MPQKTHRVNSESVDNLWITLYKLWKTQHRGLVEASFWTGFEQVTNRLSTIVGLSEVGRWAVENHFHGEVALPAGPESK